MKVIHEYSVDSYYHRLVVDDVAGPWASLHQLAHFSRDGVALHACGERLEDGGVPEVFTAAPVQATTRRPEPPLTQPVDRKLIWDLSAVPVEQRVALQEALRGAVDELKAGPFFGQRAVEAVRGVLQRELSAELFDIHEIIVAESKTGVTVRIHVAAD